MSVGRHVGRVIDESFIFYWMLCLKACMDLIFLWFGVIKLSTMVSSCSGDMGVVRQIFVFDRQRWLTIYWSLCLMDRTGKRATRQLWIIFWSKCTDYSGMYYICVMCIIGFLWLQMFSFTSQYVFTHTKASTLSQSQPLSVWPEHTNAHTHARSFSLAL